MLHVLEVTATEVAILRDLKARTGLSFRKLGGIDTRQKALAEAVLPILQGWPERIDDASHRRAVYARFHTPYAYPYIDKIISWWTEESDDVALSLLTQDLILLVKAADAERIWRLCQQLPPRPWHYWLVARLAEFPTTNLEATNALVRALNTDTLKPIDLEFIGKVDDPRIRQWFRHHSSSGDGSSKLARTPASGLRAWPKYARYVAVSPDRRAEIFSTEVNIAEAPRVIAKVSQDFSLRIPFTARSATFLRSADLDRWICIGGSAGTAPATLWFRLEDIDSVEIVLTRGRA